MIKPAPSMSLIFSGTTTIASLAGLVYVALYPELPHALLLTGLFSLLLVSALGSYFAFQHAIRNEIGKPIDNLLKKNSSSDSSPRQMMTEETRIPQIKKLLAAYDTIHRELHETKALLDNNSMSDSITGLPSRSLFKDRLQSVITEYQRNRKNFSLLCVDINRFKEINDSLGQDIGDTILHDVSKRLSNLLRDMDTIARLGDDEFAIILKDTDIEGASNVAEKILVNFGMPFFVENHQLLVGPSIGIAEFPLHANSGSKLLQKANYALNIAKNNHLGFACYDESKIHDQVIDISLASELRDAINGNNLQLFYQPKFSLTASKVVEVEALLRWIHPDRGFIPPDQIINVAESSGLIHPLTEWVARTAIQQQKHWEEKGVDLGVAINLSVYNLQNPHLISIIQFIMSECETNPERLILEITEGAMMRNPEQAKEILSTLDKMNIKIAIDDFGTGYSSLAYLKNLPVDELKIDRSFVMNLKDDDNDLAIVRSTIDLAHNLDLSVVAEGVENQESWDKLHALGCDLIQGYYLSKPLPAEEFINWYHSYNEGNKQSA